MMARRRNASEKPKGLLYEPALISIEEEDRLLDVLGALRFDAVVLKGMAARRTARHYGLGYDYGSRTPRPGEPIPTWLCPVRLRAAELAGVAPDELVEILVQRYPPGSTIGWHRDAPAFGVVIGVSLRAPSRLRLRRREPSERSVWEIALEPRSAYVLAGEARSRWEHSIPAVKDLRYSITLRTLAPTRSRQNDTLFKSARGTISRSSSWRSN
jgi:alkylated DNA repair dioxygenase AlkB